TERYVCGARIRRDSMSFVNSSTCESASSRQSTPSRSARSSSGSSTSVTFCAISTSWPTSCSARRIRSAAWYVAAWPRCVESYGVMPQTETRAIPGVRGRTGTTFPERLSCSLSGMPEAGRGSRAGEVQECTRRSYDQRTGNGSGPSQRVDHAEPEQAQQRQARDDAVDDEHQVRVVLDDPHEPDDHG